jgi:cardiolipin synthase
MLDKGIEIYEYQSNVLHAKVATADDKWTTIGSYNLNEISALASLEANLDVRDNNFAVVTRMMLEELIRTDCKRIDPMAFAAYTGFFQQIGQRLSFYIIHAVLHLFTFYFRQE